MIKRAFLIIFLLLGDDGIQQDSNRLQGQMQVENPKAIRNKQVLHHESFGIL